MQIRNETLKAGGKIFNVRNKALRGGGSVNVWFWQNPDPRSRFLWKWNISFMDQLDLLAFHTHFPSPIRHEIRNFNQIANKVKSKFPEIFAVIKKEIKELLGGPGDIGGGPSPPQKSIFRWFLIHFGKICRRSSFKKSFKALDSTPISYLFKKSYGNTAPNDKP